MKQTFKTVFALSILAFGAFSCKDQENNSSPDGIAPVSIEVKDGRLNFNKLEDFNQEISNLSKTSKPINYVSNLRIKIGKNSTFSSLRKSPEELAALKINESEAVDTLVQDDLFASFLNDKKELSVDNIIYKITPEGTYACKTEKYNRLLEILSKNPKHGNSNVKDDEAGDSKTLEDGIFFYDSFASPGKSKKVKFEVAETFSPSQSDVQNARVNYNYLPASVYNSFESHAFGKKTIVGKWIESVLGNKEAVYIKFPNSDNERLKLTFFDTNYLVFKSIGVKAEAQHKTWIGWGGNLKVEELRLGWDAINFDTKLPGAPTTGLPSVSFNKLNLGSLGIDVANFTIADGQVPDPLSEAITKAVKGVVNEAISTTVSKLYTLLKQNLGNQNVWEKQVTAAFRIVFPDKITTLLGRYEEIENNADQISRTFDWSTPILGFSVNGGAFQPIYKTGTTYDIKEGSVYACATRFGNTIGIRIVKD